MDTIERQAAIDALDKQIKLCDKALASFDISMKDEYAVKVERASLVAYREKLKYLPSAQPEVIACGEGELSAQPKPCDLCEKYGLEDGDTLYCSADWDGGIGFDYIRDIHYCPKCGRRLVNERSN